MPTILRIRGLRVAIYPNDHQPKHVHVVGADCRAVFQLNCPDGPLELREQEGFRIAELRKLEREIAPNLASLCEAWGEIHDQDH